VAICDDIRQLCKECKQLISENNLTDAEKLLKQLKILADSDNQEVITLESEIKSRK